MTGSNLKNFVKSDFEIAREVGEGIQQGARAIMAATATDGGRAGSPEERRASLERLRSVGRSVTESISAFRERMTASFGDGVASGDRNGDGDDSGPVAAVGARDEAARLATLVAAGGARERELRAALETARAETAAAVRGAERSGRQLAVVRAECDRLAREAEERRAREAGTMSELVRLRGEVCELENELKGLRQAVTAAEGGAREEKRLRGALERVCMGLRRRVAVAEEEAKKGADVDAAVCAKEAAEATLAAAKADVEDMRVRAAAASALKERADAAERAERSLRERVSALEREVDAREVLVRQGAAERNKLKAFMTKYELELDDKEKKLARLRQWVRRRRAEEAPTATISRASAQLSPDAGFDDSLFGDHHNDRETRDLADDTLQLTQDIEQSGRGEDDSLLVSLAREPHVPNPSPYSGQCTILTVPMSLRAAISCAA